MISDQDAVNYSEAVRQAIDKHLGTMHGDFNMPDDVLSMADDVAEWVQHEVDKKMGKIDVHLCPKTKTFVAYAKNLQIDGNDTLTMTCDLHHGHGGTHHDPITGARWYS